MDEDTRDELMYLGLELKDVPETADELPHWETVRWFTVIFESI